MAKQTTAKKKQITDDKPRAKAVSRYLRISPRKVRPVINEVRLKPVHRAFDVLYMINKKAARMTEKLLKSAVANAKVLGLDEHKLIVSDVFADGGPTAKRFRPRSMGRADRILKRTTHLSLYVKEGERSYAAPEALIEKEETQSGTKTKKKKKAKAAAAGAKASK